MPGPDGTQCMMKGDQEMGAIDRDVSSEEVGQEDGERPALLVTGASGLLGSCLARTAGRRWEILGVGRATGVDLTDGGAVERAFARWAHVRAVVHLAAYTDVTAAFQQQGDRTGPCYRVNVDGTRHVARACRVLGLPLVHVSTDFVFGGDQDGPYREDDPVAPIEWYGQTKAWAEQEATQAPVWTVVRISYPYVPPPAPRHDLIKWMRARLEAGAPLALFTDQIITPTFGPDIATGLLSLAGEPVTGSTLHLSGATALTPHALGQQVAHVFGHDPALVQPSSLVEYLTRDARPRQRCLRLDTTRWQSVARARGLASPLGIPAGLHAVQAAPQGQG